MITLICFYPPDGDISARAFPDAGTFSLFHLADRPRIPPPTDWLTAVRHRFAAAVPSVMRTPLVRRAVERIEVTGEEHERAATFAETGRAA